MTNQNKKEKCVCFSGKEHDPICDCSCHPTAPPSKSSSWEERLEAILDDNFPKLNADNPEIPSSNNRSAALVMFAYTKILIQNLLASEKEKLLNEVLEKMPKKKKPEGLANALNGEENGFNQAISETLKVINSLKGEK